MNNFSEKEDKLRKKMRKTISQMERGAQGSVDWHIKNWNADFDHLKKFARCTIRINNDSGEFATSNPVVIRFFLLEGETKDDTTGSTTKSFALCGKLVSGGRPPMLISVNVETNMVYPLSFNDCKCRMDKRGHVFTVSKDFMVEGYYGSTNAVEGARLFVYPRYNQLHFKITATILNFNKDTLLDESMEGAEGEGDLEASLVQDIQRVLSAGENFSEVFRGINNGDGDKYFDIQLATKDNNVLQAHQFILAARSPGFRKLFEQRLKPNGGSGAITATSTFSSEALTAILHWMYTEELPENSGNVMEEVLEACVKFEIPGLLKVVDKKLITICTVQNMGRLYQLAQQHGLEVAGEAILDFYQER